MELGKGYHGGESVLITSWEGGSCYQHDLSLARFALVTVGGCVCQVSPTAELFPSSLVVRCTSPSPAHTKERSEEYQRICGCILTS